MVRQFGYAPDEPDVEVVITLARLEPGGTFDRDADWNSGLLPVS
jgi:hypothetical protein